MRGEIKAMLLLAGLAAACSDRSADAADGAKRNRETPIMDQGNSGTDGVRGLPSSFGKSFATLDEYLEHLRNYAGPIDLPWYRQVRPGVYEMVTSMRPAPTPKTYTRDELIREFGFKR